jgi:hypothetical protein
MMTKTEFSEVPNGAVHYAGEMIPSMDFARGFRSLFCLQ